MKHSNVQTTKTKTKLAEKHPLVGHYMHYLPTILSQASSTHPLARSLYLIHLSPSLTNTCKLSLPNSVTRFGEILLLWQKFTSLWQILDS